MTSDRIDNSGGESVFADVLTAEQVDRLREHWIETIEQFLSAAATDEGRAGMCRLLDLTELEFANCARRLAEGLPSDIVEGLKSTRPGGELGANLPQQAADRGDSETGDAT
jgi:hypothetical protein